MTLFPVTWQAWRSYKPTREDSLRGHLTSSPWPVNYSPSQLYTLRASCRWGRRAWGHCSGHSHLTRLLQLSVKSRPRSLCLRRWPYINIHLRWRTWRPPSFTPSIKTLQPYYVAAEGGKTQRVARRDTHRGRQSQGWAAHHPAPDGWPPYVPRGAGGRPRRLAMNNLIKTKKKKKRKFGSFRSILYIFLREEVVNLIKKKLSVQ